MITRDVNFDETKFGSSTEPSREEDEDAMLDLDLLEINDDDVRQVNYKQTCKRKLVQPTMLYAVLIVKLNWKKQARRATCMIAIKRADQAPVKHQDMMMKKRRRHQ